MPFTNPTPDLHFPTKSTSTSQRDSTASDSSSSVATEASFQRFSNHDHSPCSRSRPASNSTMASSRPSSVASNASGCSSPRLRPAERNSTSGGLSVSPALLSPGLARSLSPSNTNAPARHPSMGSSRRPSMPIVPSMTHRVSTVSVASFDSLPEGETVHDFTSLGQGNIDRVSSPSSYHAPDGFSSDSPHHPGAPPRSSSQGSLIEKAQHRSNPRRSLQRSSTDPPPGPSPSYEMLMKKRLHIVMELLDTEKAYVASLTVLNESYYQPLLAASSKKAASSASSISAPALSRKALGEIFSNFIDIYHLNTELLACLSDRLSGRSHVSPASRPSSMATGEQGIPDLLVLDDKDERPWDPERDLVGDLLLPIAPFLKMYSLYVKNFSSALVRTEAERKSNDAFSRFLRDTEKATWGKGAQAFGYGLGFQAHLLTLVQRIPRYKMLVGDLLKATPPSHQDHEDLKQAYAVIEQVASYINENIRQHEMVLTMLSIQRSLTGLNEPLVIPGRSLLKRGTLLKARRRDIQARVFFLFSDCIIYASPVSGGIDSAAAAFQALTRGAVGATSNSFDAPPSPGSPRSSEGSAAGSPFGVNGRRSRTSSTAALEGLSGSNQQLQFRARFNLQDCTVVGVEDHKAAAASSALLASGSTSSVAGSSSSTAPLRHCFEIRTPDKSFAVYAARAAEREAWLEAIRTAREEHMSARRTLQTEEDSIEAKRHRRRSQHRLYPGGALSGRTIEEGGPESDADARSGNRGAEKGFRRISMPVSSSGSLSLAGLLNSSERASSVPGLSVVPAPLRVLEDYHAPVWVPDSRADMCSSCSEPFGLWRRRHHCRLCGQVVCWACSTRTFLIASYEDGEEDKPARACDGCYDSVFPEEDSSVTSQQQTRSSLPTPSSSVPPTPTEPRPSMPNISAHVIEPRPKRGSVRFGPDVVDDDAVHGSSYPETPERSGRLLDANHSPHLRPSALRRQSRDVSPKSPRLQLSPLATRDAGRPLSDDYDVAQSPISPIEGAEARDPLGRAQRTASRSVDQLAMGVGMGRPTSSSGLSSRRWAPGSLYSNGNASGSASNLLSSSPSFSPSTSSFGAPPNFLRSSGAGTKLSDSTPFSFLGGGAGALTPHAIQAATSGSGTFRLVTPRLTTPERETPPVLGAVNGAGDGGGGGVGAGGGGWGQKRSGGAKTDLSYFTFQDPALENQRQKAAEQAQQLPAVQPRRKPLSAAARLSTFYGAGVAQSNK